MYKRVLRFNDDMLDILSVSPQYAIETSSRVTVFSRSLLVFVCWPVCLTFGSPSPAVCVCVLFAPDLGRESGSVTQLRVFVDDFIQHTYLAQMRQQFMRKMIEIVDGTYSTRDYDVWCVCCV